MADTAYRRGLDVVGLACGVVVGVLGAVEQVSVDRVDAQRFLEQGVSGGGVAFDIGEGGVGVDGEAAGGLARNNQPGPGLALGKFATVEGGERPQGAAAVARGDGVGRLLGCSS